MAFVSVVWFMFVWYSLNVYVCISGAAGGSLVHLW